ncbi:MAG: hypothetical protein HFH08_03210 [Bacilli bacterium]|nr:hypothetical protein [Bacilli bacterium]
MKKKLLITIIILSCCFSIAGCNRNSFSEKLNIPIEQKPIKQKTNEKLNVRVKEKAELNEIEGVLMRIKKDTLTRTSATIIIYDYTLEEHIYGSSYRIDKKENGKWTSLKSLDGKEWTELMWNLIGYHVDEHDRLELNINWENIYGALPNGEYRIVKDTSKQGEMKQYEFSVEFIIE